MTTLGEWLDSKTKQGCLFSADDGVYVLSRRGSRVAHTTDEWDEMNRLRWEEGLPEAEDDTVHEVEGSVFVHNLLDNLPDRAFEMQSEEAVRQWLGAGRPVLLIP